MPTWSLQRAFSRFDEDAASSVFGPRHPLTRALMYRRCFAWQGLVASIPLALGVAGAVMHDADAPAVLAAAGVVQLVLLAGVLLARQLVRERVQTLIADGAEDVPLRVIADERQRLLTRKERESLARSLERALHSAQHWQEILPASRPPHGVRCLRFTAREVREVASLLRAGPSEARGVALTAQLLAGGYGSALYAGDVVLLREALNQIRYLLASSIRMNTAPDKTRLAA